MAGCDWRKEIAAGHIPVTQLVGQTAQVAGLEGLRVRSAVVPHADNLVVFPQNLRPGSDISIGSP